MIGKNKFASYFPKLLAKYFAFPFNTTGFFVNLKNVQFPDVFKDTE